MKEFTRNAAKVRFIWFEKYLRDFVSLETIFERMCLDLIKKQKKQKKVLFEKQSPKRVL